MKEKMVSFPAAFKLFFTHYVDFTGRSTRAAYWWWQLWSFLIGVLIFAGVGGLGYYAITNNGSVSPAIWVGVAVFIIFLIAWAFGTLVPSYALLVRRFRDAGVSPFLVIVTRGLPMVMSQWLAFKRNSVNLVDGTLTRYHLMASADWMRDGIMMLVMIVISIFELVVTLLPTKHRPDDDF